MQPIVVELPEQIVQLLTPTLDEAALRLQELALIELFRRGDVSSGCAAEKLGMRKWDFIQLLAAHKVPYIDLSEEELHEEIEVARSFRQRRAASPPPTADH